MTRESMNFDVLIIGAGPSGLSASIKLAQLAKKNNKELNIAIVEKSREISKHVARSQSLWRRYRLRADRKPPECPSTPNGLNRYFETCKSKRDNLWGWHS